MKSGSQATFCHGDIIKTKQPRWNLLKNRMGNADFIREIWVILIKVGVFTTWVEKIMSSNCALYKPDTTSQNYI